MTRIRIRECFSLTNVSPGPSNNPANMMSVAGATFFPRSQPIRNKPPCLSLAAISVSGRPPRQDMFPLTLAFKEPTSPPRSGFKYRGTSCDGSAGHFRHGSPTKCALRRSNGVTYFSVSTNAAINQQGTGAQSEVRPARLLVDRPTQSTANLRDGHLRISETVK